MATQGKNAALWGTARWDVVNPEGPAKCGNIIGHSVVLDTFLVEGLGECLGRVDRLEKVLLKS